jgi:hypothetical protein
MYVFETDLHWLLLMDFDFKSTPMKNVLKTLNIGHSR